MQITWKLQCTEKQIKELGAATCLGNEILAIEKSLVLQYNGEVQNVTGLHTIQRKIYGCCTVKQCKEPNDSVLLNTVSYNIKQRK